MQLNKHFAGGLENNQHHPTKENKPIFIVSSCFARWVLNFIVLFVELYSVTQEVGDSLNGTLRFFFSRRSARRPHFIVVFVVPVMWR